MTKIISEISTIEIKGTTFKLKYTWDKEVLEDLKSFHGIDAYGELDHLQSKGRELRQKQGFGYKNFKEFYETNF